MKAEPIGIIGDPEEWPVVQTGGGPLVKITLRPGVFVKMREEEARARGLLPPREKAQRSARNKMRKKPADKAE